MSQRQRTGPQIKWDGREFFVTLPLENGKVLDAKWNPSLTYVVRVREVGEEEWSMGFETPLTSCTVVDLKPDTEYEMQVRAKNAAGEGEPAILKARTGPKGELGNILPFRGK
ncbi:MAG: fibronectin type III domain-containing protein [Rhodospirillales bacterium]|nr:fibronectin type III domain-containing protein [Rhodospirillales bacterium]